MNTPTLLSEGCPKVVAELDLLKPAMIEASAGTGKTYAIEHLLLRLLIEFEDLDLQNILVLTFTDKATGELKEKIRNRLTLRLTQGNLSTAASTRIKSALLGFDRAAIFTIHGFCDRVLKKYAFENQNLFQNILVKKEKDVFHEVLKEEMRSTWLSDAGTGPEGFSAFKALTDSVGFKSGTHTKWEGNLINLAQEINPSRGDKLLPEYSEAILTRLEKIISDFPNKILELFPELKPGLEGQHPFAVKFKTIKFSNKTVREKAFPIVVQVLQLATQFGAQTSDLSIAEAKVLATEDFLQKITLRAIKKESFLCLTPKPGEFSPLPWPELDAFLALLVELQTTVSEKEVEMQAKSFAGKRRAIFSLREKAQEFKRDQGMITFNDMIEKVWIALNEHPESKTVLRQDYRYCLVDEFQDTDPLQWNIFRSVFLENPKRTPLFLIGDPKQAIYRFRGGDIHTYMAARKTLYDLSRRGLAQGIGLDTNFRSSPKMILACNQIFSQAEWFHPLKADPENTNWHLPAEPDPLGFVMVHPGGLAHQETVDGVYSSAPIIVKDFSTEQNLTKNAMQRKAYIWIATEIKKLMETPDSLLIPDKISRTSRPLQLKDICILVASHCEKKKLEKACMQLGIPTQIEKQAGLYNSDIAGEYLAVLESLEDLANAGKHARALLTKFFRYSGQPPAQALPESIHPLFESWIKLATRKKWQQLFHSMVYQTGVLYRACLELRGDRDIMDYLHIGQNLVQLCLSQGLTLSDLVQTLRDLRAGNNQGEEDADFHREDSEGGKVTLMTMHVSKGLEFPVVFLAGVSPGKTPAYFKYRDELNTIYHLDTASDAAKAAHKSEVENEERRLYYVALTRAQYKLYIPLFPKPKRAKYGPLGGFVAQSIQSAAESNSNLFFWSKSDDPIFTSLNSSPESKIPLSTESVLTPISFVDYPLTDDLSQASADFSKRRRRLSSYSLLVHHTPGLAMDNVEGRFDKEEAPITETDEIILTDTPQVTYPANALPRGKDIGNMFHEILEKINFTQVAGRVDAKALLEHKPTFELIQERMHRYRLDEAWQLGIAEVIWNTLNTELPDPAGGEAFALSEIKDLRPEMEFLFPYPSMVPGMQDLKIEGYLGGFIDLVFRHRGRYYLLDWKSNYLNDYKEANLTQSILDARYDLQYRLYALALDKWLRSLLPNYAYDQHFGGIYYIYLRGIGAKDISESPGIFALRPTASQIQNDYPHYLETVIEASGAPIRYDK